MIHVVAEKATPRIPAEGRTNQHQQQAECTTVEPPPAICAHCSESVNVYQMGDQWICADHLAAAVSLAACDVWPDMVRYTHEFEAAVL